MPESLTAAAAARVALARIVDYAGLFPPAQLAIQAAAREYRRCSASPHAWMLGRFVVPAASLAALDEALGDGERVAVTAILDGQTRVQGGIRVKPETCEVLLPLGGHDVGSVRTAVRALRKGLEQLAPGLPVAVEFPRGLNSALLAEGIDALAEAGFTAKIRCGGPAAEATPSVDEVASVVRAFAHAHVPFKATAGLHHPVRHFNMQAGFVMHGFLNVLAAACAAPAYDAAALREIVAEEEPGNFLFDHRGFAWRGTVLASEEQLACVRRERFLAFGSCSFVEPVEDLTRLGILPAR